MVSLTTLKRPRRPLRGRDFSQTSYRAPSTVKRLAHAYNQPKPRSHWGRTIWIFSGAVLASVIALAIFSPLLNIRNVIIAGAPAIAIERQLHDTVNQALQERGWGLLPNGNLILLNTNKLAEAINQQFNTHGVTFQRVWPNVLRVALPPNALVAVWQAGDRSYLLDQQGSVAQDITGSELPPQLPRVHQIAGAAPSLNQSIAAGDLVGLLQQLPSLWATQVQTNLAYIEVDSQNLPSVRAYTTNGWYAYLTAENPLQGQIMALHEVLGAKIQADEPKLEYIDVRFGSKLYYKLKDVSAPQLPNTTP